MPAQSASSSVPSWRGVLASIDIGSNSFRLEIGQTTRGRYRRIDYLKETVRLGAGLDAEGRLSEEAAQRGLVCLQRFRARLAGIPARQLRAVATQTLREAANRDAFREAPEVYTPRFGGFDASGVAVLEKLLGTYAIARISEREAA